MDTAQWPQEIVVKPIEEIVVTNTCPKPSSSASLDQKKPRPQKEQALNCPRCHSTNTKFCYYNNYSLTQPRYFCKTCRRYWTEGGSLRNIPVGGGSRKNKRPSSSSPPSISNSCSSSSIISPSPNNIKLITNVPDLVTITPLISTLSHCNQSNVNNINNPKVHDHDQGQDLNLAFPAATSTRDHYRNIPELVQQNHNNNSTISASASSSSTTTSTTVTSATTTSHHHISALELLTGITAPNTTTTSSASRGLNSLMPLPSVPHQPDPNTVYSNCGYPLQDFKAGLNFSLDGINGSGFASLQGVQESGAGGRLLFPFEDLKQVSSTTTTTNTTMDQNSSKDQQGDSSNGYWTGMLGGGGSWYNN